MNPCQSNYHSYLLRLWQIQGEERAGWRASLEDVQTGELQGFSDLATLLVFLEEQTFAKREDEEVLELQPD